MFFIFKKGSRRSTSGTSSRGGSGMSTMSEHHGSAGYLNIDQGYHSNGPSRVGNSLDFTSDSHSRSSK